MHAEHALEPRDVIRAQAELLEVVHDAILVRDPESRITYWTHGAGETYGWKREEALGNVTHSFLQTQFPISLSAVDEELARGVELLSGGNTNSSAAISNRECRDTSS